MSRWRAVPARVTGVNRALALLALFASLALAACGSEPSPSPSDTAAPQSVYPSDERSASPTATPSYTPATTPEAEPEPESQPEEVSYPRRPLHTGEYTLEEIFNQGSYVYVTIYAEILGPVSDTRPHVLCTRSPGGYHECVEFVVADTFVQFEAFVPVGTEFQVGASSSANPLGGSFEPLGLIGLPPSFAAGTEIYYDIQFDYRDADTVNGVPVPEMYVK